MFSETGLKLMAKYQLKLLKVFFIRTATLHDGAIIIKNNLIISAGCILPISNKTLPKKIGVRHRVIIGITEESDAIAIVVSEETGKILCKTRRIV